MMTEVSTVPATKQGEEKIVEPAPVEDRGSTQEGMAGYLALRERILASTTLGVVGALIALTVVLWVATPYFMTVSNFMDVARQMSIIGIMAVGVSIALISGQIDLSVGSTFGLSAVIFALAVTNDLPVVVAVLASLTVGLCAGLLNGLLSTYWGLPSFIVTLGMLQALRGTALMITDGSPVSLFGHQAPGLALFSQLGQGRLFGLLPMQFILLVAVAVAASLLLYRTDFGLRLYASGSSSRAAELAGVRVPRTQTTAFMISGFLAALGGLVSVSFIPNATPTAGTGLEFVVFAAAVLGGISLFGGEGRILGAVLGAAVLAIIRNGLVLLGVSSFAQTTITGMVIIAAIGVNVLIVSRRRGAA